MIKFILQKITMSYDNYIWYKQLYILVKKELNVNNIKEEDINENDIIKIINKNINQIGNYFKLIIKNIYSLDYHLKNKKYKFLSNGTNTNKNNNSKEIISSFFLKHLHLQILIQYMI